MFILSTFQGFERAYPLIVLFGLLMVFFITHNKDYLMLFFALEIISVMNLFLKNVIFKKIMGSQEYLILGKGTRPKGAQSCGEFINIDERESSSYGMPSGHSNFSAFFAVVMIIMILNDKKSKNIRIFKIGIVLIISGIILFSRINLGGHTYQQVIMGGLIGSIFGYIYISNIQRIKTLIHVR